MSANKYIPHVLVLPEDDANTEIANGFMLHESLDVRAIDVLGCAGGWSAVRETFNSVHVAGMRKYGERDMVLLVDFDERSERLEKMKELIPPELEERVFVIGVWSEPENLPRVLGSKEEVGYQLANECCDETRDVWNHDLLRHNAPELGRMTPLLFPSN